MEFVFNDGGRVDAGYKGLTGDCVTRAVTIASGLPYQQVYDRLAVGNYTQRASKHTPKQSRTAREGINTKRKWFKDYMVELGFIWTATMQIGSGCTVHLLKDELPTGTLIVSVSKHYTVVVDGVLHDTHNPSREGTRCVYGYWRKSNEN
jgi:hypothetical protein